MCETGELSHVGKSILDDLFLYSADEDYLVARWAAIHGHLHQYLWSSSQCIEKILKHCLLSKKVSIKSRNHRNHDIVPLFTKVVAHYPEHDLTCIRPNISENQFGKLRRWEAKYFPISFHDFFLELQKNGPPSSRYRNNINSRAAFVSVHALDKAFFTLRNIVRPHVAVIENEDPNKRVKRIFERVTVFDGAAGSNTCFALFHQNAEFFPDQFTESEKLIGGMAFRNNALPIKKSNATIFQDARGLSDINWILENARISPHDRIDLENVLKAVDREAH